MNLDGKDVIKPTPFDAHEKIVRGHHTHSKDAGYESAKYEHQEFPKAGKKIDKETGEAEIVEAPKKAAKKVVKRKAKAKPKAKAKAKPAEKPAEKKEE